MRKTYLLLLFCILTSWQVLSAYFNSDENQSFKSYLSVAKLDEIATKVTDFFIEESDKTPLSIDDKSLAINSVLQYPINSTQDYNVYSCIESTTAGTFVFDLNKIVSFYELSYGTNRTYQIFLTQADVDNNTNALTGTSIPSNYEAVPGSVVFIKMTDVVDTTLVETKEVSLLQLQQSQLGVDITLLNQGGVCYDSPSLIKFTGTPGATIAFTIVNGGTNQSFTVTLNEAGSYIFTTPNLIQGGTSRIIVNSISLDTCTYTYGATEKMVNIGVRQQVAVTTMVLNDPLNTSLCNTGNIVPVRVNITGIAGYTSTLSYLVNGTAFTQTVTSSPVILNITMPTGNPQVVTVRLVSIETVNTNGSCFTGLSNSLTIPISNNTKCTVQNINPFCYDPDAASTIQFPNSTNNPDQTDVYCLGSIPNPSWYFLQVDAGGNLSYTITQSTTPNGAPNIDVDFIAYGPFTGSLNPLEANTTLANICCSISQINIDQDQNDWDDKNGIVGCSYSGSDTENFTITGARPGDIYVVLLTNFANQPGYINLTENPNSTGSTSCDIVCPLYLGEDFTVCPGTEITLRATIDDANSYKWFRDGVELTGEVGQSLTTTSAGTFKVVVNKTGCKRNQSDEIKITHEPVIELNQPNDIILCDQEPFDLRINNPIMINNVNDYVFTYHLSYNDALTGINSLQNVDQYVPDANLNLPLSIYVAVRSRVAVCPSIESFIINYDDCPVNPGEVDNIYLCEDPATPGFAIFDLTNSINQAFGEPLIGRTFSISVYASEEDANLGRNPITTTNAYSAENNTQIWYRKQDLDNYSLFDVTSHFLYVIPTPTGDFEFPGPINVCIGANMELVVIGTPNATISYTISDNVADVLQLILDANGRGIINLTNLTTNLEVVLTEGLLELGGTTCRNLIDNRLIINVTGSANLAVSNDVQACLNSPSPVITLTPDLGQAPYTVIYTINGGTQQTAVVTGTTLDLLVPTNVEGEFTYNFISIEGSGSSRCVSNLNLQVQANILPLPTAFISGDSEICNGTQGNYTITGEPNSTVNYVLAGVNQTALLGTDGTFSFTHTAISDFTIGLFSVTNTNGCSNNLTDVFNVNVVDLPTATIAGTTSICHGTSTTITISGPINATVTYTVNGVTATGVIGTNGELLINTGNLTVDTTFELVSIETTCTNVLSGTAVVTILNLPTVAITGNQEICNGNSAEVTFTGTPNSDVVYTVNGVSNTITLDAITGNYTLSIPTITSNTTVQLVSISTNAAVSCTANITDEILISIIELPTATITGNVEICNGSLGNYTISGRPGATVNYVLGGVNQTALLNIDGTFSFTHTGTSDFSINLVSIEDANGCSNNLTDVFNVNVVDLPTATITGTTSICDGTSGTITINGTPNATVTYTINGTTATGTITNAGTLVVNTGNLSATTTYELVSIESNCLNTISGSAVITILDLPTATIEGNQTICNGNDAIVQFSGTPNATLNYTVNGVAATVTLNGVGTQTITLTGLTVNTTVQLVSISTNSAISCSNNLTEQILINVIPVPTIINVAVAESTICSGEATGIQITGNTNDVEYRWTVLANGVTGATAGTGNVISQTLRATNTTGTVTYRIIPFIGGCEGLPQDVTITVTPIPVLTLSDSNLNICTNENASVNFTSNIPGAIFTWNAIATNGIQGATGGNGTGFDQVLINSSDQIGTVTYTVTPYFGNCQGTPKTVVVTVYPEPRVVATPTADSICSGESTNISLTSNVTNVTYSWTVIANGVTGATPGTGNTITQTLSAIATVGTVEYIITPTVNGCVGEPISVIITVTPTPEIFANSNPPAICSESFTGISLSASIPGTTFEWTVVQNGVEGAFDGAGDQIDQQLFTTSNFSGTAIYTVTPYANGCAGESITIRIRVNPLPMPKLKPGYICYDPVKNVVISTYTLTTGLSSNTYSFVWMLDGNIIPGATLATYEATEAGEYTVEVRNNTTNCVSTQTVFVSESNPAVNATFELTSYFNDSQTITVNVVGNGNYIYQLNDGLPQESNVFNAVLPGTHRVTITDEQGCTYLVIDNIVTMHFPNFFTPNGDGNNDTWNIWSLSGQENALISIFDRYGKLVKQISPRGEGWDGATNGTQLPATDYWFQVDYFENGQPRTFKSHFSLKR